MSRGRNSHSTVRAIPLELARRMVVMAIEEVMTKRLQVTEDGDAEQVSQAFDFILSKARNGNPAEVIAVGRIHGLNLVIQGVI